MIRTFFTQFHFQKAWRNITFFYFRNLIYNFFQTYNTFWNVNFKLILNFHFNRSILEQAITSNL